MRVFDDPEYPGYDPTPGADPLDVEFLRGRAETVPGDWKRWFRLGFRHHCVCQHAESLEPFRRAVELAPWSGLAWYMYASALSIAKRVEEAERAYRRTVELRPEIASAWRALGSIHFCRGDFEGALEHYKRTARLEPDADLYWSIGRCLMALVRRREAVVALEECIRLKPNHLPAHAALAVLAQLREDRADLRERLRILYALNEERGRKLFRWLQEDGPVGVL